VLRRQRVWVIFSMKNSESFFGSVLGAVRKYLLDPHRADTIGAWDLDKARARFWHKKEEAESEALLVVTRFPQYVGKLTVTHRLRKTHW
jgi:hypothetical protein